MSSRRKERLGGGQTTARSSRLSRSLRVLKPLPMQPSLALEARAQTATATGYDQILRAKDLRRATTGRGASYRSSQRHEWHHEHTLPFPAVISTPTYDPDESNKFYASSSACRLGRIFSDPVLISPSWARASTSPWGQSAKKCGGYGKRIPNGSNSPDTPVFMYSKLFERHQKNFSWKRRPRPFAYRGEAKTAVSDDTPKFFHGKHTQVYGQPVEHDGAPRLIKILLGRQAVSHRPGGVRDEGLGKDRARLRMNLVGQPPPHASTRAPSIRIYLITREPQISSNGVQFLSALKAKTHAAPRNPPRDCEQIIAEPVVRETDLNAGTLDWDNTPLILRSKSRSQERG